MDKLTNEERALAWKAAWHPAFAGIAIVNSDFSFRSVNPQFCELLGVTPAELIGQKFQDITPPGIRELELRNAQLIREGQIDFYVLPKKFQFADGKVVNVILLTVGVKNAGKFLFFVSRIMLNEDPSKATTNIIMSDASSPTWMNSVGEFATKYFKIIFAIATAIAAFTLAILDKYLGD